MPDKQYAYCFTWNNSPDNAKELLLQQPYIYLCWGNEIAPTTGTPHLQGYIRYRHQRSMRVIEKALPKISLRPAYGSAYDNKVYCSKDDPSFQEYGDMPKQGARTDLKSIKKLVDTPVSDLIECGLVTNHQQLKFAESLQKYHRPASDQPIEVLWFYGDSGTGKTRQAMSYEDVYIADLIPWYDGYSGQKTILLDDFRIDTLPFEKLLRLLDRYPVRLPVKGSSVTRRCDRIIITAPVSAREMYSHIPKEDIKQLLRRITYDEYFPPIDI